MPKGSFLDDTFEKLAELGTSTAKKAGQSVVSTISPTKIAEQITGSESSVNNPNAQKNPKEEQEKDKGHTKLNLKELQQNYQSQDDQKVDALRNKLFQLVKSGDEKILQEKEKEKNEKEQKSFHEDQQKRKKKKEVLRRQSQEGAPQGKERKSIFGKKKKKAQVSMAEIKPSVGKQ